jgi:lipoate-protein ligase B
MSWMVLRHTGEAKDIIRVLVVEPLFSASKRGLQQGSHFRFAAPVFAGRRGGQYQEQQHGTRYDLRSVGLDFTSAQW